MKPIYILVFVVMIAAAYSCPAQKKDAAGDLTVVFGHTVWGTGTL